MTRTQLLLLASALVTAVTALLARPWLPLVALFVVVLWAGEIQAWMSQQRRQAEARAEAVAERPLEAAQPPVAATYLDALDSSLGLPAELRMEIRAELSDHLIDSIAALEAEGLAPDSAAREALARLGRPEELARQMRAAHQSTRRLLAGAAGGVWSAGVGVIQGYLVAVIVAILLAIIGTLFLQKPIDFIASNIHLNLDTYGAQSGSLIGCMLALGPAFIAGRRAVRSSSELSHRTTRELGRWWALAGILGIGWLVTFELTVRQSWLVVPFELAIPLAFGAGALVKADARLPIPRMPSLAWLGLVVVMFAVPLVLGAAGMVSTSGGSGGSSAVSATPYDLKSLGYDRVAPAWSDTVPSDTAPLVYSDGGSGLAFGAQIVDQQWTIGDAAGLARFADIRFEVWRATAYWGDGPSWSQDFGPYGPVDSTHSTPYATVPAERVDGSLRLHVDLSHIRHGYWLIFVTGTGPDGHRYRLAEPDPLRTLFSGTIWDWLTAAD
jgi:hypothetical protein